MFDNIRCKMKFPIVGIGKRVTIYFEDLLYQTKNFDQILENYIINQDGDLYRKHNNEFASDVRVHHTGLVNFYTFVDHNMKQVDAGKFEVLSDWWIEFKAEFVDGHCQEIETVEIKFREFPEGDRRYKLV